MVEISEGILAEIPFAQEKPRNVQMVNLPEVDVGGRKIKLGMHTDTTLTLLRTISSLPDVEKVSIEGRVLTAEQKTRLESNRVYLFFLLSRFNRNEEGRIFLLFGNDINVTGEESLKWIAEPFSPASLADKIGHHVGYFSAADLVTYWKSTGRPNDFLPLVGGINQFRIGSNTLSPDRLAEIQASLEAAFCDQEGGVIPLIKIPNPYNSIIHIESMPRGLNENKLPENSLLSNIEENAKHT